jgi:putative ABC transport system permease protein
MHSQRIMGRNDSAQCLISRPNRLFGVTTKDPLTFAGVVAVMALVALCACYVPAYRAMRVEPTVALQGE